MFRVLTNRKKSRLTSPRFVVGSVAAHLVVALLAVNAWAEPPEVDPTLDQDTTIYVLDQDPPKPLPAPAAEPRTPAPPAPAGPQPDVLQTPTTVPIGVKPEPPGVQPLVPDLGRGPAGISPGPVGPDTTTGDQGGRGRYAGWTGPMPADMVDVLPTLANATETARLLQRNYPDVYVEAGVAGRTVVEIVVETNGRVRPGSARIVDVTHPLFGDATLRIIERMRFRPAKVLDQPVAVLVQIPIDWQPAN